MTKKNKGKIIAGGLIASLLPLAYIEAGNLKFESLFKVKKSEDIMDNRPKDLPEDIYKVNLMTNLNWLKDSRHEEVRYESYDGLKLYAVKTLNHQNHKLVILLHGANQDHYGIINQAQMFDEMGYDTLLVDLRAFGKSEGEYTSFGHKEATDLAKLINILVSEEEKLEIGLYGISIGAISIIMYLSHLVKSQVKWAIVESAFASAYSQLSSRIENKFLFQAINRKFKKVNKFDLKEIDCLKAIESNKTPILILHSEYDDVVSVEDAKVLYERANSFKEIHIFDSKSHMGNNLREDYRLVIENYINSLK